MFNSEQRDHMKYLASLSPEIKCWCGWHKLEECSNGCPKDVTQADRIKVRCKMCGNSPHRPGRELVHIVKCPNKS